MRRREKGHTLLETLVVLAIIGTLMALAMPSYVRAIRMAKQTAADEAKRQTYIIREVDKPADRSPDNPMLRENARTAFRRLIDAGKFDIFISEPLYRVTNDAEFAAYWHTLLNPMNHDPLQFEGGNLVAQDEQGNTVVLPPTSGEIIPGASVRYPMTWDFISANMADMSIGNIGTSVVYSDGTREYLKYPGAFPATATVAQLSRRFMGG